MTPYELIDLLPVTCSALLVWAVVATLSLFRERKENKAMFKSREDLIEKLTKSNHSLQQKLEDEQEINESLFKELSEFRIEKSKLILEIQKALGYRY